MSVVELGDDCLRSWDGHETVSICSKIYVLDNVLDVRYFEGTGVLDILLDLSGLSEASA